MHGLANGASQKAHTRAQPRERTAPDTGPCAAAKEGRGRRRRRQSKPKPLPATLPLPRDAVRHVTCATRPRRHSPHPTRTNTSPTLPDSLRRRRAAPEGQGLHICEGKSKDRTKQKNKTRGDATLHAQPGLKLIAGFQMHAICGTKLQFGLRRA